MNARRGRRLFRLGVALAAVSLLPAGGALAGDSGGCITATVPWPFALPDGSLQPAGSVTLCLSRAHGPTTGMHEVRVDRHPIGLYLSRRGRGEDPAEGGPVMVFGATARGTYRLLGYAVPLGDTLETFRFYDPRADRDQRLLARAPLLAPEAAPGTVLLAAAVGVPR